MKNFPRETFFWVDHAVFNIKRFDWLVWLSFSINTFCRQHLKCFFLEQRLLYFDLNFTKLQVLIASKSVLFQAMVWCRQTTSYYLKQYWPKSSVTSVGLNGLMSEVYFSTFFYRKCRSTSISHNPVCCFLFLSKLSTWTNCPLPIGVHHFVLGTRWLAATHWTELGEICPIWIILWSQLFIGCFLNRKTPKARVMYWSFWCWNQTIPW